MLSTSRSALLIAAWPHAIFGIVAISATFSLFFTLPGLVGVAVLVIVAREMRRVWRLDSTTCSSWLPVLYYGESLVLMGLLIFGVLVIGLSPTANRFVAAGTVVAIASLTGAGIALGGHAPASQPDNA